MVVLTVIRYVTWHVIKQWIFHFCLEMNTAFNLPVVKIWGLEYLGFGEHNLYVIAEMHLERVLSWPDSCWCHRKWEDMLTATAVWLTRCAGFQKYWHSRSLALTTVSVGCKAQMWSPHLDFAAAKAQSCPESFTKALYKELWEDGIKWFQAQKRHFFRVPNMSVSIT